MSHFAFKACSSLRYWKIALKDQTEPEYCKSNVICGNNTMELRNK